MNIRVPGVADGFGYGCYFQVEYGVGSGFGEVVISTTLGIRGRHEERR